MHCLTRNVLVTRTVPQSRALSDNFSFVANVKVYECKNLRLSVLDSIDGMRSFAEPLVRWSGGEAPRVKAVLFLDVSVQYFAVFINFSGDNHMKHFKT